MNLPNKITVFRFCCIPFLMAFSLIEFKYHWVAALLVYFIACMSDKADGIIARKKGLVTDFGKVMDPLSDKTLVFAAYLVFINMGWHTELCILLMLAREFLVAGIRMLAAANGEVIAPEVLPALADLPGVTVLRRPFSPEDLEGADFVIAAADDRAVNARVSALCRGQKRPVNVVDDPARCSFLFPALVRRGSLSVGISTGGSSPTAAVWLKEQIEGLLPEHTEEILTWLEGQRPILKERLPHQRERAACFARLFAACLALGRPLTEQERERELGEDTYG